MLETLVDFGPIEDRSKDIIKVIGVGGGGCNAVNNMYREGIANVTFAVCNTDSQSLKGSPVPVKIQLGESGLGAGANPELGRKEAENTVSQIRKLFDDNTKMCFVTAGMGGGTGTGAAPVVAAIAKNCGVLTIGIVTIPFFFEKRNKIIKALKGVEEMRKSVDALLIVNNERLCDIYADAEITIKDAFKAADRILSDATKSISELITLEGIINLDFRDVETTMRGGGGAIMAIGRASGERRVEKAIINALDSPLLYGSDISKAKNILFNIYTGDKTPLFVREMQEIDAFMYELDPNIDVIWGTSDDNTLGDDAKVIILATGLDNEIVPTPPEASDAEKDQTYYEEVVAKLYREALPGHPTLVAKEGRRPEKATAPTYTFTATEISEDTDYQRDITKEEKRQISDEPAEASETTGRSAEPAAPPATGQTAGATPLPRNEAPAANAEGHAQATTEPGEWRKSKSPSFVERLRNSLRTSIDNMNRTLYED